MTMTSESAPSPTLVHTDTPPAQKSAARPSPRSGAAAAEIPVVVHATRYLLAGRDASEALPPLHEETRTAIVFAEGAVVQLSASVGVGQLVVLTNQQSGADALCRVVNVKAQPGVQNYVDLEFTQGALGFWSDSPLSEAPIRVESPLPALAGPTFATAAAVPDPGSPQQAISLPVPAAMGATAPTPTPISAIPPIPAEAPKPVAPSRPRAARVSPSSPMSGVTSSSRAASFIPRLLAATWNFFRWRRSRPEKVLLAATFVTVVGLTAAGFMLGRRSQSAPPASPAVSDAAGFAELAHDALIYSETHKPNSEGDALSAAEAAPAAPATSTTAIRPVMSTRPSTPAESESTAQPEARPSGITVEKLRAPVRRRAAAFASGEPPSVLMPQGAENVLGGLLTDVSGPDAPGGQLDAPKLIYSPSPLYPVVARAQNIQGVVVIDALVDTTGKVTETKVLSGPTSLRQAATEAVSKWKYLPARLNGQPIAMHISLNISFTAR
jgi:periplasmic protein TonB